MNSQETLWFIGKCLSLVVHPERDVEIQATLQSGAVKWESLVYHSSNQLVLPALFLNLKRNHLVEFLPSDLVAHFENITNQNQERNKAILNQIEVINHLLNPEGIKPIYLKGTAHLLDGYYEDIAERMLSDIDFLLKENDARIAWEILIKNGYKQHKIFGESNFEGFRHLPELVSDNYIASVEIHTKILKEKYHPYLNYSHLKNETVKTQDGKAFVPSIKHQILHNILNAQSNDKAHKDPKVLLRNSYDLLLLSQKEDPLKVVKEFRIDFDVLNNYLALSADLLDYPPSLSFERTKAAEKYIKQVRWIWENTDKANRRGKLHFIMFRLYRYFSQFFLFFIDKQVRKRIIKSLSNRDYYKAHWAMYKKWFS